MAARELLDQRRRRCGRIINSMITSMGIPAWLTRASTTMLQLCSHLRFSMRSGSRAKRTISGTRQQPLVLTAARDTSLWPTGASLPRETAWEIRSWTPYLLSETEISILVGSRLIKAFIRIILQRISLRRTKIRSIISMRTWMSLRPSTNRIIKSETTRASVAKFLVNLGHKLATQAKASSRPPKQTKGCQAT